MLFFKGVLFTLILTAFFSMSGRGVSRAFDLCTNRYEEPAIGFLAFLGVTEAIGWPFVAFRFSSNGFLLIVLGIAAGFLISGLRTAQKCDPDGEESGKTGFTLLLIVSAALVLLMIILTALYYRPDADDAFYVSNVALFSKSQTLNPYDSSFGNSALGTVPMYDFQIYESLMAILCRVFGVTASVLMHSVCIPLFLLLSASAYLFLGRTLAGGSFKGGCLFFILLSIAHLFAGYSGYSEGVFLLGRIWQGKSLCLVVILPVMTALILRHYRQNGSCGRQNDEDNRKEGRRYSLQIALCALTGFSLNPTSSFILGFQLLFMTAMFCVLQKKLKLLKELIPYLCVAFVFLGMIYLRTSQYSGQIADASVADGSLISDTIEEYLGGHWLLLLFFLISVLFILKAGTSEDRMYLVYTPLLMLAVLWNPWSGRFVAQHVTTVPTYWRVFWLMPIAPSMARASILLIQRCKKNMFVKAGAILCALLIMSYPFKFTFGIQDRSFKQAENWEKLAPPILILGKEAVQRKEYPVILACRDFSTTLRQEFTSIELIVSREQYIKDLFLYRGKKQEAEDRLWLDQAVNGLIRDDPDFPEKMAEKLEQYQVDFLIIKSNRHQLTRQLKQMGWEIVASTEAHALFQKVQ